MNKKSNGFLDQFRLQFDWHHSKTFGSSVSVVDHRGRKLGARRQSNMFSAFVALSFVKSAFCAVCGFCRLSKVIFATVINLLIARNSELILGLLQILN